MKKLIVTPSDWPCTLADCPPGLFTYAESLCVKTTYTENYHVEAYLAESGEAFWGGEADHAIREKLIVQPCHCEWVEE